MNDPRKMIDLAKDRLGKTVAACRSLVQTDTQNPPGDTRRAAELAADFLRDLGWRPHLVGPSKQKTSVVASLGKIPSALVFCSHLDVVPAGELRNWKYPPFSGRVSGGRLYGRGSADAKGPASSMLAAVAILTEHFEDEVKRSGLSLMLVADEEIGGHQGSRWVLIRKHCRAKSCIIGEPSYWSANGPRIVIGERGIAWYRLKAAGKPAHASMPSLGRNAILELIVAIRALQRLTKISRKPPTIVRSASHRGKSIMARLARRERVNSNQMRNSIDHYTINVGTIRGGTKTNVVADSSQAEVDIRIPIGASVRETDQLVRRIIPKEIKAELFNSSEPSYSPETSGVATTTARAASSVLQTPVPLALVPYTSDAHWFREISGVPVCTFGPGYVYHVYNEFVQIKQLVQSSAIYALAALTLM